MSLDSTEVSGSTLQALRLDAQNMRLPHLILHPCIWDVNDLAVPVFAFRAPVFHLTSIRFVSSDLALQGLQATPIDVHPLHSFQASSDAASWFAPSTTLVEAFGDSRGSPLLAANPSNPLQTLANALMEAQVRNRLFKSQPGLARSAKGGCATFFHCKI